MARSQRGSATGWRDSSWLDLVPEFDAHSRRQAVHVLVRSMVLSEHLRSFGASVPEMVKCGPWDDLVAKNGACSRKRQVKGYVQVAGFDLATAKTFGLYS